MVHNSERVIFGMCGLTVKEASTPTNIFAAVHSDSAPDIFIKRVKTSAKNLISNGITFKKYNTESKAEKKIIDGRLWKARINP
jgi:hypothetical protein